jgi:hypothetical protein
MLAESQLEDAEHFKAGQTCYDHVGSRECYLDIALKERRSLSLGTIRL